MWPQLKRPTRSNRRTEAGLKAILAVGREGTGNTAAAAGWKAVTDGGVNALVPTLAAFGDANPTAENWLRTAVDAIVEAEKQAGRTVTG